MLEHVTHVFLYISIVVAIIYIGFGLTLCMMQPRLTYYPEKKVSLTPETLGIAFEDVTLNAADGLSISGWYVQAADANDSFTVLLCHGNGGNIMHRLSNIELFYNLGINCLIFDYRGYGKSEGKPDEQGTYDDAMAAYNWLIETKRTEPSNIIIYGQSLGGSVAAWLAARVQSRSLVLEGTFTSYLDMAKKFYWYMPVRFFARYKYNTIEYVTDVHCPVLVIHSKDDEIVPFKFGQRIYEAANKPKEFVEMNGGHNNGFLISAEKYKEAWRKWLKYLKERQ